MTQSFILLKPGTGTARDVVIANLVRFLGGLSESFDWCVEVKRHQKRRSDQQNRYLWGVVYPAFLRVLEGWDAEDVHEYLLGEFFGWERLQGMGRTKMKPVKRSSKLSKQEFAEYVDFCQRKGAEHGIYIADPEPI
jgi:hypothetical protein